MIAATSLSSRVTLNLPVRARAVSTRAARAAVVRVAADGEESSGYKSMNVTKPNIVNNLDGETTRNIDGKVYTITVKGDEVTVKDKFGQVFPARVNKSAIIEADLSNSVAGANTMSIGGMNFALTPDQVTSLFAGCSSALQRNASRVLDALGDFVRVGLDDLDAAADGVTSLGVSLASDGVKNMDYDSMLLGILNRAEATLGSRWDESARQRWASVVDVFCDMCRSSAPVTPKSKITEPKKTKKSYTGGYYKKFQIYMGWKKAPAKIPFNLPADASDSLASPGPGATPRHVDRRPRGAAVLSADPWRPCRTAAPRGWRRTPLENAASNARSRCSRARARSR